MRAEDKSLFSLIHDYLKIYLPKQRPAQEKPRAKAPLHPAP